jgi:hypothetical protein
MPGVLIWEPVMPRDVLRPWQAPRIVEPRHKYAAYHDPFFYEDSRHVFFVTSKETPVWISDYPRYFIDVSPAKWMVEKVPELVHKVDPRAEARPHPWGDGGPVASSSPRTPISGRDCPATPP